MTEPTGIGTLLCTLISRDLRLVFRQRADIINPLLFFILVAVLFPFSVGPEKSQLQLVGVGVIVVCALLAVLMSLERLFRSDYDEGVLQYLLLAPYPTALLIMPKLFIHWLTTGLPLVLLSPVLAIMFYLPFVVLPALILSLILAMPLLSLLGAISSALTVGLRKGGVLIVLLTLPFYIPVLILMTACIHAASQLQPWQGYIMWLSALLVLTMTLAPFAIAQALKISHSD